ncbi:hypothetical protein, partial [Faecalibacterium sp. An192]|uniref:hypothetical protein n=1 Tax=Faecalibacterium sp. An192 TaxID=1965581 RepID=UPI0019D1BF31
RLAWLRSRFARPVFDSLVLPLAGLFFVLSAQYGAVHNASFSTTKDILGVGLARITGNNPTGKSATVQTLIIVYKIPCRQPNVNRNRRCIERFVRLMKF